MGTFCVCTLVVTVSVLVIYCCVTNRPKTQRLKTTSIYYLLVSVGQESTGLAGCLWLRASLQAAGKVSARATVNSRLSLGKIYSQAHSCGSGKIQFLVLD